MAGKDVRERAIVLKKRPYKDNDAYVDFFGEQLGKFTALAKGINKTTSKLGPALNIGNCVMVQLIDGESGRIVVSCQQEAGFEQRYESYEALLTTVYLCDLTSQATEEGLADASVFSLLYFSLATMNDQNFIEGRLLFEWNFLIIQGVGMETASDVAGLLRGAVDATLSPAAKQSIFDEVQGYLQLVVPPRAWSMQLVLSKPARQLLRQILNKQYRAQLPLALNSKTILNQETAAFYS